MTQKIDIFKHNCCRKCGHTLFAISGRWADNPGLNRQSIVGSVVSKDGNSYRIVADDSSPKLGSPSCFFLAAEKVTYADCKIKSNAEQI